MPTVTNPSSFSFEEKLRPAAKACGRALLALLFLLALAAIGANGKASSLEATGHVSNPNVLSSFTVADFDGDRQPDFASVNDFAGAGGNSIGLRLSAGSSGSIPLPAVPGSLSIEARDVDGDGDLDLIVRTLWLRQPVAVFLNDGHGTFSRAAPALFTSAFTQPAADWASRTGDEAKSVAFSPQFRGDAWFKSRVLADRRTCSDLESDSLGKTLFKTPLLHFAGRAPPLKFPAA